MASCRCDPTQVHEQGPFSGLPHRPAVFRAVVTVRGVPAASRLILHCRRCKATWPDGGE